MNDTSPPVEIDTAPDPRIAVILMHGLGADANDFVPLVPELGLAGAPVRFIFPNAPHRAVTGNNGYVMRAWYDIRSFESIDQRIDEAGIEESCATVRELIAAQNARGIPTSKIFLAGFSQGAAMTYSAGLTHPEALAGLIVMSGYIPSTSLIGRQSTQANRNTPIFAAHGDHDPILPLPLGEAARDFTVSHGSRVEWHAYPMAHSVCGEEVADLRDWLGARIAALV
ncbi:alpha/beta hydrolase [Paraburkholderia sp. BCC1886]|uniref:alpha/beta hydrolase n=1 Tax=Paraburkholderia sp. BCC1886 TaxID=2562670 RepID=UPI00118452D9|nr:alpha/beta hydrolase [Paraburkholderia sp. BCC1886]